MNFIRKSIFVKSFLLFFTALIVLFVFDSFGVSFFSQYVKDERFKLLLDNGALIMFFVFASAVLLFSVHRPLSKVFREMKAFLAGHAYKKIFTARIDEMGVLAHFFNDVTGALQRASLALNEGKRMSEELSLGSDIQKRILPVTMPMIPGLMIYGNTRPASEVGGDSFDIIQTGNNTLVYIGDVTGHGLPAALIMVMVNTILRTYSEIYQSGYDLIANTNRILKQRIEQRRFMTCVLLRWNLQEQKLYYTGAGHEHILIYHKREGACEIKQTGGIALGMVPDVTKIIKEEQIPFEAGDQVVLYSDGIIEAKNIEGEMFGLRRLQEAVQRYGASSTPGELFNHISRDFGAFAGDQIQEDDITLIALQRQTVS